MQSPSRSSSFVSPLLRSLFSRRSFRVSTSDDAGVCDTPFRMSSAAISTEASELDLSELAARFKKNVTIKDRRYRLQTYKSCFVGSEAVQWLVTSGSAQSRADAVRLGLLMQEAGIIEHCLRDHDFKDEELFYKFIEDSERGGVPKTEAGRLVTWADFVQTPFSAGRSLQPKVPESNDDSTNLALEVEQSVWPMDEENIKLLDNVHPPEWIEPVYDGAYNLVVIGAGAGGLVTSSGAAGLGAKVALIEANRLGGDCLNVGCVPSKSLIHAANLAHTLRDQEHLAEAGLAFDGPVKIDFGKTMKRLRRVRADISKADAATRYTRKLGVDVYFGYAKFTSESTVEVNGKTLHFRKAIVATGGYPAIPPIPGLRELHEKSVKDMDNKPHTAVMTNETFFNLTELPRRLGVIGTGVIGMELGQAMQRLGSSVVMFGRSGQVLPKEDKDLSVLIKEQMIKDGVTFSLNVSTYEVVEHTGKVSDEGYEEIRMVTEEEGERKEYLFDAMLVATGRKPNVDSLNLKKAGVEYDNKRGLKVNDMLQTTNPKIYGVGDVCSAYKFTHAADFMARMVIRNALFFGKDRMSNLLIPYATFTEPEIAHVGLYESDMKEKGIRYKTFEKHFDDNDRAICDGTTVGMVRIHVEEKSDSILGASIVGAGAGNMISEITLAMQSKTGLGALASVIHPYPTTAEAVRQTGDLYNRTRLTNTVKQLLRGIVRVQR
ncbi:Pyridine nucleotide-disulfide oxidoreductase [Gracilaria domingensis]|nr:Pyridine nucleotide-disulfide oxidoreductase [Gracilaria domingensis]